MDTDTVVLCLSKVEKNEMSLYDCCFWNKNDVIFHMPVGTTQLWKTDD